MAKTTTEFPPDQSVGYLIRAAHRRYIQDLQSYLAPHDIPIGMWYFLRALWQEDGLTQRELSERVGSMGPTTAEQLDNMEQRGYIVRCRSDEDRRKVHVRLTPYGRRLRDKLLRYAKRNNANALNGFSPSEVALLRSGLLRIIKNLDERASSEAGSEMPGPSRPMRRRLAASPRSRRE
jgi:DNA-binding MarR family transcriptional regulator